MKKIILLSFAICLVIFALLPKKKASAPPVALPVATPAAVPRPAEPLAELPKKPVPQSPVPQKFILLDVPFVVQAPFGNWKDPRQQDACEEAAILIAMSWSQNKKAIDKQEALNEIFAMVDYQTKNFGEYRDTSASDSARRLIGGYFKYPNYEVKTNITIKDILAELNRGNLVITPSNGQKLKNPFFTPPGPERHMVVIRGFDPQTEEFITNDPGISQGEEFRYPMDNLFAAIRDYPTGYHVPIIGEQKVTIVVKKSLDKAGLAKQ